MLIKNKGIQTDTFRIPSFDLNEGEIVVLYLFNGVYFHDIKLFLQNIFCGNVKYNNVVVHKKMTFVEYFIEPNFRRFFYPITVGEYLKKNSNLESSYATKIYDIEYIKETTKVNTLAGNPRKLLTLYATLSKTSNIVFDLMGQDPKGAEETYRIVKDVVKKGGSAILLDGYNDMRNDCTKYIELQWLK